MSRRKGSVDLAGGDHAVRGLRVFPGGLNRSTFFVGKPAPMVDRAEGYSVWDEQGRRTIDLNNNFTALIHGHNHPAVAHAVARAAMYGVSFGLPNRYELEHAEHLVQRLDGYEQVRYTNSGTEAVMLAVRLARAHTGRDGVVVLGNAYHGTSDTALASGDEHARRGIPAGVLRAVHRIGVNDTSALREVIACKGHAIAAIVLDFMPNRLGLIPLSDEFVQAAQALCHEYGIILIADEVVSVRLRYRGLATDYGITPGLCATGKVIGGGLPVGAVLGRAEIMAEIDPRSPRALEHGGTFTGNPLTMAAGLAAMDALTVPELERINGLGDRARVELNRRCGRFGWEVRGTGSIFRPFPIEPETSTPGLRHHLWWAAYDRGVLLSQHLAAAVSTPMNEEVIDEAVDRLTDALGSVEPGRQAER